jgi:hypothetical protein
MIGQLLELLDRQWVWAGVCLGCVLLPPCSCLDWGVVGRG